MHTSVKSTKTIITMIRTINTIRFSEQGRGTEVLTLARKLMAGLKSDRKHKGRRRLMKMSNWVLSKVKGYEGKDDSSRIVILLLIGTAVLSTAIWPLSTQCYEFPVVAGSCNPRP
ncbi:hypothetical protein E2542_SST17309 [Spatholobus suberectus]|nr:hypothetical protein E2542_SST17309 [Spatholobus suberectus]